MRLGLIFAAALIMLGSSFIFDSDLVKQFPIPYPVAFLALASLALAALMSALSGNIKIGKPAQVVGVSFIVVAAFGSFASILSGAGDMLALGMKIASLFFNWAFFLIGCQYARDQVSFRRYGAFLVLFATLLGVALYLSGNSLGRINPNWVGITVLQAYIFLEVVKKKRGLLLSVSGYLLVAAAAFFFLEARGVTAAAALAATAIVFISFLPRVIGSGVVRIGMYIMPLVGLFVAIIGVWLYNSPYYFELTALSMEATGKALDSSRLARWDEGFRLMLERPVFGWGLDAHLSRAAGAADYGDTHNFFIEFLFRGGIIALAAILVIFFYIARTVSRAVVHATHIGAYLALFVLLSVYALGGVTHWPGSFNFWLIIGAIMGMAVRDIHIRNTLRARTIGGGL